MSIFLKLMYFLRVKLSVLIILFFCAAPDLYSQSQAENAVPLLSHPHGFYHSAFDISLTTTLVNAQIIYTTDGSEPNLINGVSYQQPFTIANTTVLRARIKNSTDAWGPVTTQSYIFPDEVIKQSNSPPGYPGYMGTIYCHSWFCPSRL